MDLSVHPLMAVALGPVHSFPPNSGFGFTHCLVLICMPLTFFVQWLHLLQSLQPPSTARENNRTPGFQILNVSLCIG